MTDRQALTDSPVSPEQAAALLKGRRTVDRFQRDACPPVSLLREAIDVARWAPNHHLTEPWRFALLGARARERIIALNTALVAEKNGADVAEAKRERWAGMPGWLVVTCVRSDDPQTAAEDHAACACAIQNLCLYLHSAGVGTKWASGAVTRLPDFLTAVGAVPDDEYALGLIWYGYPLRRPRSQRRELDDIIRHTD